MGRVAEAEGEKKGSLENIHTYEYYSCLSVVITNRNRQNGGNFLSENVCFCDESEIIPNNHYFLEFFTLLTQSPVSTRTSTLTERKILVE